ncbi:hypothetical protein ASF17_01090 [Frigoribacterium sp. Leaf263]|uniref:DUF6531 domain-containing protein n=1 Tax=Frigoribacterium sp. Leaf263 TaxID=1736313 RepID=UPI0006F7782A|nr:DUF6531 domain-containing protein [Frigoribacterium sp. Leaf263]KQO84173.1 hypothetical protein ASF17_01090 [Frigoribacterium sp. Leaf263]
MTEFTEVPLLPQSDSSNGGRFVYSTASDLKSTLETEAGRLDDQAGSRASYVSTGQQDFAGRFSELFAQNAATAAVDASALASSLRTVAGYVGTMVTAARDEDDRRRENNEWVRRHNDKDFGDEVHDFFFGEEERPNADPGPAPTFPSESTSTGSRETPAPGSGGGGGGGASSARPADLRSFATGSRGLDDSLAAAPGTIEGALATFVSQCSWGRIDADGVVSAYRRYLAANANDASWADTVAAAFESAGGTGDVSTLSDAALADALAAAGVSATRSALTIDPPTAAGAVPTSGYANDPVNTATGNFIEPETDLAFPGADPLALDRMYNSLPSGHAEAGVFGVGWSSVLDQTLVLSDEGARWVREDGRAVDFPRAGAGFDRAVGESLWLARETVAPGHGELTSAREGADEFLVVRDNGGRWWAFTAAGLWLGTGSGRGRTISVGRDDDGPVTRLLHSLGRFVDVEHVDGRVAVVAASDGRRCEYVYDEGRLVEVVSPIGSRTYRWNSQGLIQAVVSAAGVVEAENTYDDQGRVVTQVTQHGRRTRFAYLPGRVTAVSDEDGSRSNSWIADAKGRLVGVRDTEDRRQSMAYDAFGNLVSFTERDGSVTVHGYDERGRRTRTVTPEGADLTYGYDEHDRVTTFVTAAGAIVAYEYADDVERNPSVIVDALGGRTELAWQRGRLASVVDPVGVRLEFDYDAFGDLVATRNTRGETARIERDQAGRPTAAISPLGARTAYRYDSAGLLVERRDPDGAVWAVEHDVAGRTTAVVDPLGARTTFEYAPNGELVRTVDPLGRAVERTFDELGNLSAATLPGGDAWTFAHDALSRLTTVTDPLGHEWRRVYDAVGTLTATIDPTGVRAGGESDRSAGVASVTDAFGSVTVRLDELGRPVRRESADGSVELTVYDAAGNPVELIDGEGGLTRLERDVAGRVVAVVAPSGATTRLEYDDCGRPWRTIDPLGGTTELTYDADQRVVRRSLPTGDVERIEYDDGGRVSAQSVPGLGTTRFGYDAAGRVTFVQGAAQGTRRFAYDAAGQLIRTVNGVGGTTRFEYDERGRVVRTVDPMGGVTTREWTALDQTASVTDPLGRTTTQRYDPAGRRIERIDPDGHVTTWSHDDAGREVARHLDARLLASITHDPVNRRVVVSDSTRPDGRVVEHELRSDRRGLLVSRSRDGHALTWEYGADGERLAQTDASGVRTTWLHDAAGRIVALENPTLGRADFTRDAAGRCVAVTIAEEARVWSYRDGAVLSHTAHGITTEITRDDDGRITSIDRGGAVTRFTRDAAGQLIASTTDDGTGSTWEYDAGGRLVRESSPVGTTSYRYDAAGQLAETLGSDGTRSAFVYDGLGRRVRVEHGDGTQIDYAWGATGGLAGVTSRDGGRVVAAHRLWVDALGELAEVDDASVWWDTASPFPRLVGLGGRQVVGVPGGLTGVGGSWAASSWRGARTTDEADPWAPAGPDGAAAVSGLSAPSITASGGLTIAGLEWLGARAYDPAARGFLSTDPLPPVLGAGWDGNPYAYAGNDPLGAIDPTGLRPLTDAELTAYDSESRGALAWVGQKLADNWEYIVGGAMVVGGALMIATGVGGPIGMMLISGGADVIIQKATTGKVDVGQVIMSSALGGFGGAAIAAKVGATGMKAALVAGSSSGGIGGAAQGAYGYYSGPGPHTVSGALAATAGSAAAGTVTGLVGGAAGRKLGEGLMNSVTRNAGADTVVMGRSMDYRVHPYAKTHGYASYEALPDWTYDGPAKLFPDATDKVHVWANKKWINYQQAEGRSFVDIGAPDPQLRPAWVKPLDQSDFYDMERTQMIDYPNYRQDYQSSWNLN